MPNWGAGLSYPTRIVGGPDSAVVVFTDTPELWGADIRIVGSIDMKDGKIVRWTDYFDSTDFNAEEFAKFKTPQASFPTSFKETEVGDNSSARIRDIATRFQTALSSGNTNTLIELLSYDVIYEDMALHTELLGRPAVEAYFHRSLSEAPFGRGSKLRHVVGGDQGGGFEWIGGPGLENVIGITVLELDAEGKVSRMTTTYDSRQLGFEKARNLANLALQP